MCAGAGQHPPRCAASLLRACFEEVRKQGGLRGPDAASRLWGQSGQSGHITCFVRRNGVRSLQTLWPRKRRCLDVGRSWLRRHAVAVSPAKLIGSASTFREGEMARGGMLSGCCPKRESEPSLKVEATVSRLACCFLLAQNTQYGVRNPCGTTVYGTPSTVSYCLRHNTMQPVGHLLKSNAGSAPPGVLHAPSYRA